MNYADPELGDRLAAEYALGTLRGPARRRFERLLPGDAYLRDLAADWEPRLNLLAESAPAVPPPARVWESIAERIGPTFALIGPAVAPPRDNLINRLWDRLGFWRAASLLAAAAAAVAVYVALHPPGGVGDEQIVALDQRLTGIETKLAAVEATPREIGALNHRLARIEGATQGLAETRSELAALSDRLAGIENRLDATVPVLSHVAVLIDKYARPMMTADLDVADGRLVLRLKIKPPRDFTDKALEVWLVPPDGTPRSLGLLPSAEGGTTVALNLPPDVAEALASSELAVSLEPSGGSTTGLPTGPVLFSGVVLPVDL
jgi:anti-sigma-K factor RskA